MYDVADVHCGPAMIGLLLGRRVALVSSGPLSVLNPTMRNGRFVEVVLRKHGRDKTTARARIATALYAVALHESVLCRYPPQISGGRVQRFSIAFALGVSSSWPMS